MTENSPDPKNFLTDLQVSIEGVSDDLISEININEVSMTESLLTPGLQTTLSIQNRINTPVIKNLNRFSNKDVNIRATRPIIGIMYGGSTRPDGRSYVDTIETRQRIYRLSNRKLSNYQVEDFQLELCDPSLLTDAQTYVSKSWDCKTPSEIVSDILRDCIGATSVNIEDNVGPRKKYFPNGIHPFQAITQQEEMALAGGKLDPSLVHFMTYQNDRSDNIPTHNFRSLTRMALQNEAFQFLYTGKNSNKYNYALPSEIMMYTFPCDFDTLSDILNGVDPNGKNYSSISGINPSTAQISSFSAEKGSVPMNSPCGAPPWYMVTNLGSSLSNCSNINSEAYLPRRKARMGLIEQDKIAIRLTVPFNPNLNAGRVIDIKIPNTNPDFIGDANQWNFGSGKYLIVNLTHNIKMGGFGTTTLECVSNTIAVGVQ